MKKFGSSIERVEGVREEEKKKEILEVMGEIFDSQIFEELKEREREKTPEELQIIDIANDATNKLREYFGLEDFDIPADNIHVIKEKVWENSPYKNKAAIFALEKQSVVMREISVKLVLLTKLIHEMIHFKSYHVLQEEKETEKISQYRMGLVCQTRDGKTEYLRNLNEAVTEIATIHLMKKVAEANPIFDFEIKQTQEVIARYKNARKRDGENLFTEDTYYAEVLPEKKVKIMVEDFISKEQRKNLNLLIDKLFEQNPDKFDSRDEVFDIFVKAMLDGNILPLGRLLEKTFGQKDCRLILRKLAELDADIEKQREFIVSL
ncbi:MAG: hypothetical protein U9P90_04065 [Patescibacteria group bacterium]|nr:hypothetical protein [Patescibacteria group bacterium]